jgi:hypothetical protein
VFRPYFSVMARRTKKKNNRRRQVTSNDGNVASNANVPNAQWSVSSSQYHQFVEICVKMQWLNRPHLLRRGSQDARELDTFLNQGMGDNKPFTRAQLNRNFNHWKDSLQSEREICCLDELLIETTRQPFSRVKSSDLWKVCIVRQRMSNHQNTTDLNNGMIERGRTFAQNWGYDVRNTHSQ